VAVDPSNRMVYVGESAAVNSSGGLRSFTFKAGSNGPVLSSVSTISSGGSGPYAILPKATGNVVYVANWNGTSSGKITAFSISASGTSYALAQLSATASTGIKPSSMVEDSDSNFVLVENAGGSPYLDAYIFDTTTSTTLDLTLYDSTYSGIAVAAQ
jgi:6-phosphogluconolactonase (cycloisomerase 2 family)